MNIYIPCNHAMRFLKSLSWSRVDLITEVSRVFGIPMKVRQPEKKANMAPRGNITPRTIMAPAAAFTMACLLFTYTRTSMREAKRNAQHERDQRRHQSNRHSGGPE
ncbi:hypothetical protein F4819DRAFT_299946 [Hypoxylon fuscum]|nr:hypothetical protein F4819DRAFT_299946 [Hypoxylon fuscum]